MSFDEIKVAIEQLSVEDQRKLRQWLGALGSPGRTHSVLDIPTVSIGKIIKPLSPDDDILGEMLEDRFRDT